MESQPQNSEFRINPENFHLCMHISQAYISLSKTYVKDTIKQIKETISFHEYL